MIGIGAFLLWKSVDFGTDFENHWVRENGGSADSNTYRVLTGNDSHVSLGRGDFGVWFLRKEAMR